MATELLHICEMQHLQEDPDDDIQAANEFRGCQAICIFFCRSGFIREQLRDDISYTRLKPLLRPHVF